MNKINERFILQKRQVFSSDGKLQSEDYVIKERFLPDVCLPDRFYLKIIGEFFSLEVAMEAFQKLVNNPNTKTVYTNIKV